MYQLFVCRMFQLKRASLYRIQIICTKVITSLLYDGMDAKLNLPKTFRPGANLSLATLKSADKNLV